MADSESKGSSGTACDASEEYRCAVEDCPRRVNPVSELLDAIEGMTADFRSELRTVDESADHVLSDLTSRRAVNWGNSVPVLAGLLSYMGVIGFLLAFSYTRAYNGQLIGSQSPPYGYLDTILGSWGTLLSAGSMLLGLGVGLASLSLNLSSATRACLKESYRGGRRLVERATQIRREYETWRPRIVAGFEPAPPCTESELGPGSGETAAALDRIECVVSDLEESAASHVGLIAHLGRMEPVTWTALRLSQNPRRNLVWIGLIGSELLALVGLVFCAVGLSGTIPWFSRIVAGLLMYVLVVFAFGFFWLMANVADFANGPGSRSARVAILQIVLFAFMTALGVMAVLGASDGVFARRNPAARFDKAIVTVSDGTRATGFLVPVSGSQDAFLIRSGDSTSTVRIPAGEIRRVEVMRESRP